MNTCHGQFKEKYKRERKREERRKGESIHSNIYMEVMIIKMETKSYLKGGYNYKDDNEVIFYREGMIMKILTIGLERNDAFL